MTQWALVHGLATRREDDTMAFESEARVGALMTTVVSWKDSRGGQVGRV